ncbi:MAG: hypothetical protein RR639_03465, partial [Hydrogenoanaerobacterium sp.]
MRVNDTRLYPKPKKELQNNIGGILPASRIKCHRHFICRSAFGLCPLPNSGSVQILYPKPKKELQ